MAQLNPLGEEAAAYIFNRGECNKDNSVEVDADDNYRNDKYNSVVVKTITNP